jgi:hypothetical protein
VIRSSDAEIVRALCLVAEVLLPACSRHKAPNSLFDAAGYHVRGYKVYYLAAFPGKASEMAGADATLFKALDTTYAKDKSSAYFDGHPIPAADATTFAVLDRGGFAKDRNHVYQLGKPMSDDPAHFELLDGGLSKDSTAVYWTDGSVLSSDPAHFAVVSNNDHYLFMKDSRTVHVNGSRSPRPIRRHSGCCRAPMRRTPRARTTGNPSSSARIHGRSHPAAPSRIARRLRFRLRTSQSE